MVSLLFSRGSGPVAWWIRWWTKSAFSHVAPCIDDVVYDAFWSTGVTRRAKRALHPNEVEVELPGADADYWKAWLDQQVGKPYDKASIIVIGLTKRSPHWLHVYVSRQGEWICSRLAATVAGMETYSWGLQGPPSPQDVYAYTQK